MGSPWKFARHGQCGAEVSELLPHTAAVVDHLSIVKTFKADDINHAFAELQMNTGWRQFGRPSMGSWVAYGLGSESRDLPGFTVLLSGMRPRSKSANYATAFCRRRYQGVPLRSGGEPILNLASPAGFSPAAAAADDRRDQCAERRSVWKRPATAKSRPGSRPTKWRFACSPARPSC